MIKEKSPHFPNVPTVKELGYNFASEALHWVVGPAGLPAEVVAKLEVPLFPAINDGAF
jgi:tripartite-type tricarboxylate transporter receptor subunit TctC